MLILEKYTENDYPLYAQLVFNEPVMNMNLGRVFTEEEAYLFFQMVLSCNSADPDLGYYKVFLGKDCIGMGALNPNDNDHTVEIEYMLLPQYWNQGHGTELVRLLLQKAQKSHPEKDVAAITDPANTYSKRILQRAGFGLVKQYINDDGAPAELYSRKTETQQ